MRTVIVFYSLSGNTAWAARRIAGVLNAELLELRPRRPYPDRGFRKYLRGGKSAMTGERPPLEPYEFDAGRYDRVIFASPLWAGRISPPLHTFLTDQRAALSGKRFAAVICCGGGKDKRAFAQFRGLLGAELEASLRLVDPKDRPSPDNDRRLEEFFKILEP